jgi:hypothetical protein
MILDAYGHPTTKQTETTIRPEVVEMLSHCEDILAQTGLGVRCFKCEALGLDPRVYGDNRPESPVLQLKCSCSRRTYHRQSGKVKVFIN